jgi:hypothetical protein
VSSSPLNASINRLLSASSVAIWRFSSDGEGLSGSACVVDGEREGACECVGKCGDARRVIGEGRMIVEAEGESEVPFKRKDDGGGVAPDAVWKRRGERYGLPLPPFRLALILVVLPFTPKYCIPDGASDTRETSLCM